MERHVEAVEDVPTPKAPTDERPHVSTAEWFRDWVLGGREAVSNTRDYTHRKGRCPWGRAPSSRQRR